MSLTAVRADVFPAELITDPDAPDPADRRRVYPVRVIVTLDEILVYEDSSPRPRLIFRDALVSYSPARNAHEVPKQERTASQSYLWAVATTDTGHALTWARASGCGCGSKLKVLSLQALLQLDAPSPTQSQFMAAASVNDR